VSSAQVWTVIGGFLAILAAMAALVLAVVRAEIAVLREHVDARLDAIDRDLQRLYDHVFQREARPPA
jgi:hypothetical protein